MLASFASGLAQVVPATVRFTVFAAEPIDSLAYETSRGPVPLRFFPTARSPRYEIRAGQPLRLLDRQSGELVAELSLPPGLREILLLVSGRPAQSGGTGPVFTVIDDSARQRAAGQLQLLNLSGLDLTGELNGRRIPVEAGLNSALPAGTTARLALRTSFRGRSYLSWHDTVPLGPNGRALLVLFPPFQPGSIEVQTRVLLDETPARGL